MEGEIKEHKKTGTKKIERRKERKIRFFSPGKKSVLFSLFHRKETGQDQKSRKSDVIQVTA